MKPSSPSCSMPCNIRILLQLRKRRLSRSMGVVTFHVLVKRLICIGCDGGMFEKVVFCTLFMSARPFKWFWILSIWSCARTFAVPLYTLLTVCADDIGVVARHRTELKELLHLRFNALDKRRFYQSTDPKRDTNQSLCRRDKTRVCSRTPSVVIWDMPSCRSEVHAPPLTMTGNRLRHLSWLGPCFEEWTDPCTMCRPHFPMCRSAVLLAHFLHLCHAVSMLFLQLFTLFLRCSYPAPLLHRWVAPDLQAPVCCRHVRKCR